jgi:glycosyltransferase involved in cell wall biosynthesis
MAVESPLTILIIGTLPPPLGGAGVSLTHLIGRLARREDVGAIVVNTGGVRGHPIIGPFRFLKIILRTFRGALKADVVSLQTVPSGLPFIAPFAWAFARLWGKPFMIRMFGGQDFRQIPGIRGNIVRWFVRRTDLYLAQTKALVASAKEDRLTRVEWYPTSRPMRAASEVFAVKKDRCRRFIYLGLVRPTKGIAELISAGERLPEDAVVDVYGPFFDGLSEKDFAGLKRVKYCGVVPGGEGDRVLAGYDCLLLPTYWRGEGYPGVIPEAYGAGLPVITTNWLSIPELVDDSCGILIEPKSADALYEAMHRLYSDDRLFVQLREGVRKKREFFNTDRWVERFVELCGELVEPCKAKVPV